MRSTKVPDDDIVGKIKEDPVVGTTVTTISCLHISLPTVTTDTD